MFYKQLICNCRVVSLNTYVFAFYGLGIKHYGKFTCSVALIVVEVVNITPIVEIRYFIHDPRRPSFATEGQKNNNKTTSLVDLY